MEAKARLGRLLLVLLIAGFGIELISAQDETEVLPSPLPERDLSGFCYKCFDTGGHPKCRDSNALMEAAAAARKAGGDHEDLLLQNCSARNKFCTIEEFVKGGHSLHYMRDCSDGVHTSFNLSEGRLATLEHNNITVCTFDMALQGVICISMCTTPLCNGPQLSSLANDLHPSVVIATAWGLALLMSSSVISRGSL